MNGQSTSEGSKVSEQWGTTVAGLCRNYGGGDRKLQLALEHPNLRKKWYKLLDGMSEEWEKALPLVQRGPKWLVQIGTHATTWELIGSLKAKGITITEIWAEPMLERLVLSRKHTIVPVFEITPRELGLMECEQPVLYETAENLGFLPLQDEVGPQCVLQHGDKLDKKSRHIFCSELIKSPCGFSLFMHWFTGERTLLDHMPMHPRVTTFHPDQPCLFRRK